MRWLLISAAVVWFAVGFVTVSLCRAAASGDLCPTIDDDDVYCPHCDGCDVYDWGEDEWWSCHGCHMMFRMEER